MKYRSVRFRLCQQRKSLKGSVLGDTAAHSPLEVSRSLSCLSEMYT
jgi:hypothetical protein